MIRSLATRTLRQHALLLAVLSAALLLFEWAIVYVAARIDMGPGFRQMLAVLLPPDVLDTIMGQLGFGSFRGAVSFGFQHPFTLVAMIAMVTVVATVPAHERETGLLDLILARPLSRGAYLGGMVLPILFTVLLAPTAILAGASLGLLTVAAPETVSWTDYIPCAEELGLLLAAVGGYGLLIASGARRRGIAVAQVVGVTLLFYWLDFMGDYWDLLETARALSPFHYYDPARATQEGVSSLSVAVLTGIALLATGGAFLNFRRQDL